MRIILYHPRFPTNNVIPPELDILPSSFHSPPNSQQFTSHPQSHSNAKSHATGHGAPSTVYRVSTTTGIHASQSHPANTNAANGGASSGSQDTLHGAAAHDGERARTPTQSNTLSQARQGGGSERPGLRLNSAGEHRVLPFV
jgi:hypothetical protein